jgi:predicted naringenin-chalcone synthase
VPELIARECAGPLGGWLDRHGLALGDVGSWCVHPGGPRVLDACAEGLGLDERALVASRDVLRRYGNMSSPTVLFVLEELRRSRVAGPTVLLGFGPGLALEAALLG